MTITPRQTIYTFILVALVSCVAWYHVSRDKPRLLSSEQLAKRPDGIANNLHVSIYNEQGYLLYRISTPNFLYFDSDRQSQFIQPVITVTEDPTLPAWQITANYGHSYQGTAALQLSENVIAKQSSEKGQVDTTITTEQLTYLSEEKLLLTEALATLKQPGLQANSQGFIADIDQEIIKLNHPKGRYERQENSL